MLDLSPASALALLRLQLEWGADEALGEAPREYGREAPPSHKAAIAVLPPRPAVPRGRGAQVGAQAEAIEAAAACDSIERLREVVQGFTGCTLRDTASHGLFAEGEPNSRLVLVGEVPDADEDRAGRLFAGASGALLDRMLDSIGLSRASLLAAPLIPWRPPGDRRVSPLEMATCLPFLHRLLALARPRFLVLMGVRPARALLASEAPLSRLRGRWLPVAIEGVETPVRALAMRHPSQLLANPALRREAWQDLLLLRTTLDAERSQAGETTAPEAR